MLDIRELKKDKNKYIQLLKSTGLEDVELKVNEILSLYNDYVTYLTAGERFKKISKLEQKFNYALALINAVNREKEKNSEKYKYIHSNPNRDTISDHLSTNNPLKLLLDNLCKRNSHLKFFKESFYIRNSFYANFFYLLKFAYEDEKGFINFLSEFEKISINYKYNDIHLLELGKASGQLSAFKNIKSKISEEEFKVIREGFEKAKDKETREKSPKKFKEIDSYHLEGDKLSKNFVTHGTLDIKDIKAKWEEKLSYLPNITLERFTKDMKDCLIDLPKSININSKPHWDIIQEKKLLFNSSLISGPRHLIFKDDLKLLLRALEDFIVDEHAKRGINLVETPVIVNRSALFNTGQLPKFEDDLFKVGNDQYLIPTAEVTLTNLHQNEILKIEQLPLRYTAMSSCFRKEAGSGGRDTRGMIRMHQFRKIELVTIGRQEDWEKDLKDILNQAKHILDELKLSYRVIELKPNDRSFVSCRTFDIEVWMPGIKEYKEISSVTFASDFQARRMKTRYKDKDGKKKLVYTYNGSALPLERTMAAIIETYINDEGNVEVPKVLQQYVPFKSFKSF